MTTTFAEASRLFWSEGDSDARPRHSKSEAPPRRGTSRSRYTVSDPDAVFGRVAGSRLGSCRRSRGQACGLEAVYRNGMASFIKSVTFDCQQALRVATFWAGALGSNVDEDSTADRAWVEPAGWGGPSLWFVRVPEPKIAKNRQHFDLRPVADRAAERDRLIALGAIVVHQYDELTVMADPEGNEFCLE
jgi:Glyoxalase-like domain